MVRMNYYKSIQNGFNTTHPSEKLSHKMYNNSGVLPQIKNYRGIRISSIDPSKDWCGYDYAGDLYTPCPPNILDILDYSDDWCGHYDYTDSQYDRLIAIVIVVVVTSVAGYIAVTRRRAKHMTG